MDPRRAKLRTNHRTIILVDLPERFADKKAIRRHFSQFGQISRVSLEPDFSSARVSFKTEEDACNAAKNGDVWRDELLTIVESPSRSPNPRASSPDRYKCYNDLDLSLDLEIMKNENLLSESILRQDDGSRESYLQDSDSGSKRTRSSRKVMMEHLKGGSPSSLTKIKQSVSPKRQVVCLSRKKVSKRVPSLKQNIMKKNESCSKLHTSPKAFKTMNAKNLKDKLFILNERDKFLKKMLSKSSGPKAPMKGTCPDMCPEKERIMREYRCLISIFEAKEDYKGMAPELAIKEYSRSSADQEEPLPHELRPEPVLTMTMSYLINHIIPEIDNPNLKESVSDWFDFCWDRLRGIRKDITQQQLCDGSIVTIIEQCARFHIACYDRLYSLDMKIFDEKINRENIMNCLSSLNHMYDCLSCFPDACANEAEFKAYQILLQLNSSDILWEFQNFPRHIQNSDALKTAVQAHLMFSSRSYSQFFDLVEKTSYLNCCLLQTYFPVIRESALSVIIKAYSPPIKTVSLNAHFFKQSLRINDQELESFCKNHGIDYNHEMNEIIFFRDELFIKDLIFYFDNSSYLVVNKRKILSSVVVSSNTLPVYVPHEVHSSFDENGKLNTLAWQAVDQEIKLKKDFDLSYRPLLSLSEITYNSDSDVQIISDEESFGNVSEGDSWSKRDLKLQVVKIDNDENDNINEDNTTLAKQQPLFTQLNRKYLDAVEVEEARKCLMKNLDKGKNLEQLFKKEKEWSLKEEKRWKMELHLKEEEQKLNVKAGGECMEKSSIKLESKNLGENSSKAEKKMFEMENLTLTDGFMNQIKQEKCESSKRQQKYQGSEEEDDSKKTASEMRSKKFRSFNFYEDAEEHHIVNNEERKDVGKFEQNYKEKVNLIKIEENKRLKLRKLEEETKNGPPSFQERNLMKIDVESEKKNKGEEVQLKIKHESEKNNVERQKLAQKEKLNQEKFILELEKAHQQEIKRQETIFKEEKKQTKVKEEEKRSRVEEIKFLEKLEEEKEKLQKLEVEKERLKKLEEEKERLKKLEEEKERIRKLEENRKEQQIIEEVNKLRKQKEETRKQLLLREKEVELKILKGYLSQRLKAITVKHYAKIWRKKIESARQSKINFPALVRLSVDENIALWGTVGNRDIIPPLQTCERFNRLKSAHKLMSKLNKTELKVNYIGDILAENIVNNNIKIKASSNLSFHFVFCKLVFLFIDNETYDKDFIKFVEKCLSDALLPKDCNFSEAFFILTSHNIPVITSIHLLQSPSSFESCFGMNGLVLFCDNESSVALKIRICRILSFLKYSVPIPLIIVSTNHNLNSPVFSEFLNQLKADNILIHWVIHSWSNWFNFCKEFFSIFSQFNLASSDISVNNFRYLIKSLSDDFFSLLQVSDDVNCPNRIIKLYNNFLIQVEHYLSNIKHQDIPSEFRSLLVKNCNFFVSPENTNLSNGCNSLKDSFNCLILEEFKDWAPKSIEQLLKILKSYCGSNELIFSQIVRLLDLSSDDDNDINYFLERASWINVIELLAQTRIKSAKSRENNVFVVYKMKDLLKLTHP